MPDVKEYIAKADDEGSVAFSEDVIASIAAVAALENDGVAYLGTPNMTDFISKKSSKGVKVTIEDYSVEISISLTVKNDQVIPTVAKAVQKNVYAAVESMTGIKATAINIKVIGVSFEKEQKKKKTEAASV